MDTAGGPLLGTRCAPADGAKRLACVGVARGQFLLGPWGTLMRMTREEWDLWTRGSPIRRAGCAGFKRNVAVAMGNWLASVDEPPDATVAVLRDALEAEEPLVREHAAWAPERAVGR